MHDAGVGAALQAHAAGRSWGDLGARDDDEGHRPDLRHAARGIRSTSPAVSRRTRAAIRCCGRSSACRSSSRSPSSRDYPRRGNRAGTAESPEPILSDVEPSWRRAREQEDEAGVGPRRPRGAVIGTARAVAGGGARPRFEQQPSGRRSGRSRRPARRTESGAAGLTRSLDVPSRAGSPCRCHRRRPSAEGAFRLRRPSRGRRGFGPAPGVARGGAAYLGLTEADPAERRRARRRPGRQAKEVRRGLEQALGEAKKLAAAVKRGADPAQADDRERLTSPGRTRQRHRWPGPRPVTSSSRRR